MTVNLQGSSFSQMIALKVLSTWGYDGFVAHAARVADFYCAKRDVFEAAMQRHLAGLAEWTTPEAGMFFWCVPPSPSLSTAPSSLRLVGPRLLIYETSIYVNQVQDTVK